MKTLIIGDIHNSVDWIEGFLFKTLPYDRVVFLGDYFDNHGDHASDSTKHTALWLKESLKHENRIHLIGNHDAWYLFPRHSQFMGCGGNTREKLETIQDAQLPLDKFRLAYSNENCLFTHAGLHPKHVPAMQEVSAGMLASYCNNSLENAKSGMTDPLFVCGPARGGRHYDTGGILWLDWSEFEPIENVHQVVGHTHRNDDVRVQFDSRQNSFNVCLDASTDKMKYIGVITDGVFTMMKWKV